MALSEKFIALTSLNQYFVDKNDGTPLSNGTLEFYRDVSRATPKPVYQLTESGGDYTYTPLPNPVNLSLAGTVVNNAGDNVVIFAYPYEDFPSDNSGQVDLYYIVCRDQEGNLQWTRSAVPYLNASNDPTNNEDGHVNQLANAQFSRYFMRDNVAETLTVSSNTTFNIAPDWFIEATGNGTITVTRVPVAGQSGLPTNPAYYLDINVGTGVTEALLYQRLYNNSGLWAQGSVSGFIAAKVANLGSTGITMKYRDSSGALSDENIFSASLTTDWDIYGSGIALGASSNSQDASTAYVDIALELPLSNITSITSIQVLPTAGALLTDILPYDERSSNRELALMGDYFIPRLHFKPIPSLMTGWDFKLNPAQFGESGTIASNTAEYMWDQTILQTSSTASVDFDRNAITRGLDLTHTVADNSYAVIQYMSVKDAQEFLGSPLSVNIDGFTRAGSNAAGITSVQVKLFANDDATQYPTLPDTIVTIATNGDIALTGTSVSNGWYEIPRGSLPVARGDINPLNPLSEIVTKPDLQFNGWAITDNTNIGNGVEAVAVVVSFTPATSTTNYSTILNSISVCQGDLATRPAPMSYDESLNKCRQFYEKSYEEGVAAGTVTNVGAKIVQQELRTNDATTGTLTNSYRAILALEYIVEKHRDIVTTDLTFYGTTSATADRVTYSAYSGSTLSTPTSGTNPTLLNITDWTQIDTRISRSRLNYLSNVALAIHTFTAVPRPVYSQLEFHYIIDARIGI